MLNVCIYCSAGQPSGFINKGIKSTLLFELARFQLVYIYRMTKLKLNFHWHAVYMFLTSQELIVLTQRERSKAQCRVLTFLGIEHKLRPDGSVVVLRTHVEFLLGANVVKEAHKERELDLSTIR